MHTSSNAIARRTPTSRRVRQMAAGGLAAAALTLSGGLATSDDAEAMGPGDGFYDCLSAGGNYMECWYWWNWLR